MEIRTEEIMIKPFLIVNIAFGIVAIYFSYKIGKALYTEIKYRNRMFSKPELYLNNLQFLKDISPYPNPELDRVEENFKEFFPEEFAIYKMKKGK